MTTDLHDYIAALQATQAAHEAILRVLIASHPDQDALRAMLKTIKPAPPASQGRHRPANFDTYDQDVRAGIERLSQPMSENKA